MQFVPWDPFQELVPMRDRLNRTQPKKVETKAA